MKAAVVRAFEQPLEIADLPIPAPGPTDVLVRMEASGLCHTDIHAWRGDWPVKPTPPFIPGHEGVGVIEAVGSEVTRVQEGDRVAIPWLGTACGTCEYCVTGWETLCETQKNSGYSIDGAYAEYATVPAARLVVLPAGVSTRHGAAAMLHDISRELGQEAMNLRRIMADLRPPLLEERGMTLTELAERVGVTVVNLSILKNGRAKAIRFSTLTAMSHRTERIWLATGVAPLGSREPRRMAMEASTLHDLSGGRAVLGLGSRLSIRCFRRWRSSLPRSSAAKPCRT